MWHRHRLRLSLEGFWAHPETYADERCQFSSGVRLQRHACLYNTQMGFASYTWARMISTTVGKFCSIGRAEIGGQGRHPISWVSTHPAFYSARLEAGLTFVSATVFDGESRPTIIGNDVWIGHGAVVLEGRRIGDGAIVAASAVVTRDVPPYAIVAGVPAKVIRYRFEPDVIAALLDWQWWNLPLNVLKHLAPDFCGTENWTVEIIDGMRRTSK